MHTHIAVAREGRVSDESRESGATAGLFILSLCSNRLIQYFEEEQELSFLQQVDHCTFVHLDQLEVDNLLFFEPVDFRTAQQMVGDRAQSFSKRIAAASNLHQTKLEVLSLKEIRQHIKQLQTVLTKAYVERGSFFRAVNNQVYQNLHPKLKKQGIKNSRSPYIHTLAPFLLAELATLLYYTQARDTSYQVLFSTCPPMRVFEDILAGKFNLPIVIHQPTIHTEHVLAVCRH